MISRIIFFYQESTDWLDNLDKISSIITSLISLGLAYYVFVYQKDREEKTLKLQWFKELIIQPRLQHVFDYFEQFSVLQEKIKSNDLSEEERFELITFVKKKQANFRKEFLDIVQNVNKNLFDTLLKGVDDLTDHLVEVISNDELKLRNERTFEREVKNKITETYNKFLSTLLNYSG